MLGPVRRRVARAVVVGSALLTGISEAGVYHFEDPAGVAHYTNVPSDPRYGLVSEAPEPSPPPRPTAPSNGPLARFGHAIGLVAERYGVDRRLVEVVILIESGGNPRAVSPKGARGLMQLMPHRAVELGVRDAFDPAQNLEGGVRHLRDLLQRFGGNLMLALAAYNAGEEAVRTYGGVPPYRETQEYVRKIRALYRVEPMADVPVPDVPREAVYEQSGEDGSTVYTNIPPNPAPLLHRRF